MTLGAQANLQNRVQFDRQKFRHLQKKSTVVIFEQSFLQAHSNAFIQLRIIFELVDGGGVVSSLTIQQLRNVDLSDNTVETQFLQREQFEAVDDLRGQKETEDRKADCDCIS